MVVVVITIDSPGNKVLDIWSGEGTEGDDISSSYRDRPGCRRSGDSKLGAMVLSLGFDLGNDSIIDAPSCPCPLGSKTFLVEGAGETLIVNEEFNSTKMETTCRWWKSVTSHLIAGDSHKLRDGMARMPWRSL
jgi:hypothetical protein